MVYIWFKVICIWLKKFPSLGTKDASYLLRIVFGNSDHSGKYNEKKVGPVKDRLKTYFEGE